MNRKISQQYTCIHFPYRSLFYTAVKITTLWISLLLLVCIQTSFGQTISFTGDAEADFSGVEGAFVIDDTFVGLPVPPDVGVPAQLGSVISGWDIKSIYFATDLDHLFVGIDYFGIAGDAEGDGDPGNASTDLISIGGQDPPDFAMSESFVVQIDLDQDGSNDLVAGVPAGNPPGGTLGCVNFDIEDCFGLYNYFDGGMFSNPGSSFDSLIDGTNTLFASPSGSAPDIEFTIDWSNISEETGDGIGTNECVTFSFDVRIFSGSFQDAGIGEDYVPTQLDLTTVSLEVCRDCAGILFGPNVEDECGVCGGNGSSCASTCDCSDPDAITEGFVHRGKTYFFGTFGDDIICGTEDRDVIFGFAGNDCIDSADGNDKVFAGFGHDIVDLGLGDDKAFGGPGDDEIDGNDGTDVIFGGFGFDTCLGESVLFCEQ